MTIIQYFHQQVMENIYLQHTQKILYLIVIIIHALDHLIEDIFILQV